MRSMIYSEGSINMTGGFFFNHLRTENEDIKRMMRVKLELLFIKYEDISSP